MSFTYDTCPNGTGRLCSVAHAAGSASYAYDGHGRVTSRTETLQGTDHTTGFAWDADGNRESLDVDGATTPYSYAAGSNRLAMIDGSAVTTDTEGRITESGSYQYAYNEAGRLSVASFREKKGKGYTLEERGRYAYDAFGLRRTKEAGGSLSVTHYDLAGHPILETDASGEARRLYVWADDEPIAQVAVETTTTGKGKNRQTVTATTVLHLHTDHLMTPRWGTDDAGTLVWRWQSDGFGQVLPEEDPDGDGTNVVVDLRFPGQVYDEETGLHYNSFRYYDPMIGRYISADPIGQAGGVNPFVYAFDSPVGLIDPMGLYVKYANPIIAKAVREARAYYRANGIDDPFNRLENSVYTYDVAQAPLGNLEYDPLSRTIRWNPSSGLGGLGCGEGEATTQSPALGLLHEAEHARAHDLNPEGYRRDGEEGTGGSEFPNAREMKVTLGPEAEAARRTGEPARSGYYGEAVRVGCVTCQR